MVSVEYEAQHQEVEFGQRQTRAEAFADDMLAAERLFPVKNEHIFPLVDHDGQGNQQFPAREYLESAGANPEELDEIFADNGEWIFPSFPYNPFTTNPNIFDRTLKEHLLQFNRIIDRSLDMSSPYNRHGDGHSSRVTKSAQGLVMASAHMREISHPHDLRILQNQTSLIGRAHDIGNGFSRHYHADVSALMLTAIMPERHDPQWNGRSEEFYAQARSAIAFHSSGKLRELTTEVWEEMPDEERWKRMVEEFGIPGLAVIAADKIDVGRERISDSVDSESIFTDPHAEVNYWGRNAGWELDEVKQEVNWINMYTPEIRGDSDIKRYPHFAKELQRIQQDSSYTPRYFEQWKDLFISLYAERMVTFADCMFALLPKIDHVDVVFRREEGMGDVYFRFERENFGKKAQAFLNQHSGKKVASV